MILCDDHVRTITFVVSLTALLIFVGFSLHISSLKPSPPNESLSNAVCDIPFDLPDQLYWIGKVASLGFKQSLNCYPPKWTNPPVVLRYNDATLEDEVRKEPGTGHLVCQYNQVHYVEDSENEYNKTWHRLEEGAVLRRANLTSQYRNDGGTLYARVHCTDTRSFETVFEDFFIFMPSLDAFVEAKANAKNKDDDFWEKPSILVLVLESTSRMNFHRSMPKTAAALRDLGPIFYMKGLTRVGDNTYPNMVAFTTGLLEEDVSKQVPLNGFPLIWRMFERRGYPTAYIDDNPRVSKSMLSYDRAGWDSWPTTFNSQPFWTYWNDEESKFKAVGDYVNCLKNDTEPVPAALISQVERFVHHAQAHNVPYFALAMLIRTTHLGWKKAETLDDFYVPFLRRIGPRLDNTILIVMGDHGDRFSEESILLRNGQIETNLPLMAIRLPPTLHQRYPQWGDTLLKNKRRLTTNLDVHKTLVEIAQLVTPPDANLTGEEVFTKNAYSLVSEEVPLTRVCADARIPDLYCVCRMKKTSAANQTAVRAVIDQFEWQLNSILPKDKCQRLTVHRIESAYVFERAGWLDVVTRKEMIEFTVQMAPSGALLRTRMSQTSVSGWSTITAAHEIDRLNMYGNQSHCIESRVLRKYCICHDVLGLLANVTTDQGITTSATNSTGTSRIKVKANSSASLINTTWELTTSNETTVTNSTWPPSSHFASISNASSTTT